MTQLKLFVVAIAFALLAVMVSGCTGPSGTSTLNRVVSEKLVAQVDFSSWEEASMIISPDCKRVAYAGTRGNSWFMVVDGIEGKQYDMVGLPYFNPDSQHVAYTAKAGKRWFVVVDGIEEKQYDGMMPLSPIFSPDFKRVAYRVEQAGNKSFVVVEGQRGKTYDYTDHLSFSPDGQRVAYIATEGDKPFLVLDGEEIRQDDLHRWFTFSPDGQRVAYMTTEGGKPFLVLDGEEIRQYDRVEWLNFSPDSQRVAYIAKKGDKLFLVLDGEEVRQYDGIMWVTFSPDSNRVAYAATRGNGWFMVVAGRVHPADPNFYSEVKSISEKAGAQFIGGVPEPELKQLFTKSALIILPYRAAPGVSGVLYQACGYGLPPLLSSIPELTSIAEEMGIRALFFLPGNAESLADTIRLALHDEALRLEISRHNLKVAKALNFKKTIDSLLMVTNTVLDIH